ncbi:acyl carrier protein [Aerophototrophica crusticola]|uniref:Acyl carrier protein n=1 Tax=Aerophototrophica crusticola TaxID=1709002 RepID=A0A858R7K9_9PROT|nr:acyl carrier protein [Rhodospirillaceae bacterium B3]
MTDQGIYDGLTEIFRDVFGDDDIVATPELTAKDVPGWDSFNHINIIVAAEVRFGVKFRAAEIESLRNVGDFARLIAERKAA